MAKPHGVGSRNITPPCALLDLGKDVFESAIVDSSVLLLREGAGGGPFPAVDMDTMSALDFPPHETLWGSVRADGTGPWSILSPLEQNVMDKMQLAGTPLRDWDVRINYGHQDRIQQAAFIINDATTTGPDCPEDPRFCGSNQARFCAGQDIQRYKADLVDKWLGGYIVWQNTVVTRIHLSGVELPEDI